jgi:hypothetical protein
MKQEAVVEQLLPLSADHFDANDGTPATSWDYIYEPDAQASSTNCWCVTSKRWCTRPWRKHGVRAIGAHGAMKAASDNARRDRRTAAGLQQEPPGRDHEGTVGNRRRRSCCLSARDDNCVCASKNQYLKEKR